MPRNPERPTRPRKLAAALMASALVLTPVLTTPSQAFFFGGGGRIVYDPRNHAENILSAARALEQINNQIAQIQNQAQMLMNDALNLANLPHSSLAQLQNAIGETQRLLADAQSLAFDVATIEQAFAQDYGAAAAQGDFDAMIARARERWETSVAGFEDSLRVQAGVVGNIDGARTQMDASFLKARVCCWRAASRASREPASGPAIDADLRSDRRHRRAEPGRSA
jgi:type IV secretion system protein TrbJ